MSIFLLLFAVTSALGGVVNPTIEIRNVSAEEPPHVHILLRAQDDAGAHIAGLTAANFEVFENGQRVTDFELRQSHPDNEPLALSLLIDISGSMTVADVDAAVAGALGLIDQMPPDNKFEIVAFNSEVVVVNSFEDPLDREALEALAPRTDTKLNDAIVGTLERIVLVPASHRAVVVLTDGIDDGSLTPTEVMLEQADTSGVAVHTIGLGEVDSTVLETVSSRTGGRFQRAETADELGGLYSAIASAMLTEYRISFASDAEPGPHELTVVLHLDGQSSSAHRQFVLGSPVLVAQQEDVTEDTATSSTVLLVAGGAAAALIALLMTVAWLAFRGKPRRVPQPVGAQAALPLGTSVQSYHLVGTNGVFPIAGAVVLGRDPLADLVVADETVSRSHAQLEQCDGGVLIQDLDSANGTTINGQPIGVQMARAGDHIAFGDLDFELRAPSP